MAGFWGNQGYIIALLFYSEIVVMNCLLLESFGSQMIGCLMGFDEVPGALTFIGVFVIFISVNITQKGSVLRKQYSET